MALGQITEKQWRAAWMEIGDAFEVSFPERTERQVSLAACCPFHAICEETGLSYQDQLDMRQRIVLFLGGEMGIPIGPHIGRKAEQTWNRSHDLFRSTLSHFLATMGKKQFIELTQKAEVK